MKPVMAMCKTYFISDLVGVRRIRLTAHHFIKVLPLVNLIANLTPWSCRKSSGAGDMAKQPILAIADVILRALLPSNAII